MTLNANGIGQLVRRLQHLCCRLKGGHTWLKLMAPHRIALVCTSCGVETPGWVIGQDTDAVKLSIP